MIVLVVICDVASGGSIGAEADGFGWRIWRVSGRRKMRVEFNINGSRVDMRPVICTWPLVLRWGTLTADKTGLGEKRF